MNRNYVFLVLITTVYACFSLLADTQKVGNYTWTYQINGDVAEISQYYLNGSGWQPAIAPEPTGSVAIPSTLGGKPLRVIGRGAFMYCKEMSNVTIPETVTNIENYAFEYCSGLT